MRTRMMVITAGLLLAGAPALGASFDCARATTPFEQAICTHPELSSRDETLSMAYQTAIGGLSKPAQSAMQAGQKAWLDFAERSCTDDAEPLKTAATDAQAECLVGQFTQRIHRLAESRIWDLMRFYIEDRYSVIPDTTAEPDAWNKVSTFEAGIPRLDGEGELAAAFAAFVESSTPGLGGEQDETADVGRQITIKDVGTRRITLQIDDSWYGHGAAHGNYTVTYAHFLRDQMRPLVASDVFEKEGWEAKLGELALAALDTSVEGGIWEDSREQAAQTAADPSRWLFTAEGLQIIYQPYEVTAYAAGTPMITIPWTQIADYTTAAAQELVY